MNLTESLQRQGRPFYALVCVAQILLVALALRLQQRGAWTVIFILIALLALWVWLGALRRRRALADTPTSRISTAAQGFVELRGVGQPLDVNPLTSPLSGISCLWYRYHVEQRGGNDKWQTVDQAQSTVSFVLDDGSDRCLVDPEGAEIVTCHYRKWRDGDQRYEEWSLHQGDALCVLGEFVTRHPDQGLDSAAETRELLAQWKTDQAALLRRFDLDRDGKLDDQEWALAQRLARGQVEKRHRELRLGPELHRVQGPDRGLYLISNHDPERLARRYLWQAALQLLVFFVSLAVAAGWGRSTGLPP